MAKHDVFKDAIGPDSERVEGGDVELLKSGLSMEEVARFKDPVAKTPDEALRELKAGNARFYSGDSSRIFTDVNRRRAQIMAQTPFVVVVGCADSRVPIEIVFDQGPGDIFAVRVAGNAISPGALGSVQYAVAHLKVSLVVILGHEGCGAVAAAFKPASELEGEPEHVRFLLGRIAPALEDMPRIRDPKARMREAVTRNVWRQREAFEADPFLQAAVAQDRLRVVGAYYEIGSGAVDFLDDNYDCGP